MHSKESDLPDRAAARHELELRRARRDPVAFAEYVYGWRPGAHHRRWLAAAVERERLVVLAAVEHGKSSTFSRAFPLFTLGRNPDARIAIISETATQATRLLAAMREDIVRNERLKEVFPGLKPAGGARESWRDTEILVERPSQMKDPSVQALGALGALLGARLDLAVLDDVCSWETTLTQAQREKTVGWYRSTLVGRMTAGAKVIVCGTPWHASDLLHELERSREYHVIRDPAVDPSSGEPMWPEAWSRERLEQRRREIGEREWSRQFLVQVLADDSSRFRLEWIETAFAAAAREGVTLLDEYAGPGRVFSGCDLGVGQRSHHDETVIFSVLARPDGRRQVLAIESGRWTAPEILERIKSTHRRYRSTIRVESNGAQGHLIQFLQRDGVRVEAHATGRNKHDPTFGIESIAIELEAAKWVVPDCPATRAWARELVNFAPGTHTGDRVMASWLALESARASKGLQLAPVPFISSRTAAYQFARDAVVAPPGEFPADAWSDVAPWLR